MNLLLTEMRRALRRRVVHVLIAIALLGIAILGVIAFSTSAGKTVAELRAEGGHPALVDQWWISGGGDGALMIAALFLLLGGLFGGASVAGAEWRAGTVTTLLTWEPRRVRLHLARTMACGLLAFGIAVALQALFLGALLPATLVNGSSGSVDAAWWGALVLAVVRIALFTAIAAMFGVALATLGRNTAFALVTVFAWVAVIEGVVRGVKPGWARYLWAENIAIAMPWAPMRDAEFHRGPLLALVTIVVYCAVVGVVATVAFVRRDVAAIT